MTEPFRRRGRQGPGFWRAAIAALVLGAGTIGCPAFKLIGRLGSALPAGPDVHLDIPGYRVSALLGNGKSLAGAARIDTTPPAGYPNGGDGPVAGVSRGYWTRLHARAFFFQDKDGRRLAIVSCDLFAIPGGLHAEVARLINTDWPRLSRIAGDNNLKTRVEAIPIHPDHLILSATHTHQGPGNFLTDGVYNDFGSPYSGFDRKLFDFLAERIATAVAVAASDAYEHHADSVAVRPLSRDDSFQHGATRTPLTRNRMPFVFGLNPDRDDVTTAVNPLPDCEPRQCPDKDGLPVPAGPGMKDCEPLYGWSDSAGCPRLFAVDARLTVLEIQRPAGKRIGVLAFFPAHPTVLQPDSPINNSDFSGVAVRDLERRNNDELVAAFFNGADGDIHMRRLRRDLRDVMRLGEAFGGNIEEILASAPAPVPKDLDVVIGRKEVTEFAKPDPRDLTKRLDKSAVCGTDAWNDAPLSPVPEYGVAGLGGGEGDRTILYDLGWREGVRGQADQGQGPKLPGLGSRIIRDLRLTDILVPPGSFPQRLPVTWVKLADLRIGAVPVEFTTAMAWRIRTKLNAAASCNPPPPEGCFVLLGLADSYSSYVATPEEYVAQDYVGASTMWGPREGVALGCGLVAAKQLANGSLPGARVRATRWNPGKAASHAFGVGFCGDPRSAPDEELEKVLLYKDGRPARDLPWIQWEETAAGCREHTLLREISNAECEDFPSATRRQVWVEEWNGSAWVTRDVPGGAGPDNDGGFNFLTMLMDGNHPPKRLWAAIWAAPALEASPPMGIFRMRVRLKDLHGAVVDQCSPKFQDSHMPPAVGTGSDSSRKAGPCPTGL